MRILAIETSCDDTGVALLDIKKSQIKILADFVSSQNAVHAPFGGVVPNLAVRAHYKNLPILLEKTLVKIDPKKIRTSFPPVGGSLNLVSSPCSEIDLIAVTIGPGLEPCLWAGVNTARVLARAMERPIVGVNHLEGHIAANFVGGISNFEFRISNKNSKFKNYKLNQNSKFKIQNLFPAICLIASGGHTQLVLIKDIGKYEVIGQTRDDAAGEAFDKVAKLLNLGYPGGPQIALNAKKGDSRAFDLPRPMIDSDNYDFSFSGLKTAVRYLVDDQQKTNKCHSEGRQQAGRRISAQNHEIFRFTQDDRDVNNLCASFQQAAIDVLIEKTIRAAKEYKAKSVLLSGGVAANQELRKQMRKKLIKSCPNSYFLVPSPYYCTDNAAMIGLAGYWKYMRQGKGDKMEKIVAEANLNL